VANNESDVKKYLNCKRTQLSLHKHQHYVNDIFIIDAFLDAFRENNDRNGMFGYPTEYDDQGLQAGSNCLRLRDKAIDISYDPSRLLRRLVSDFDPSKRKTDNNGTIGIGQQVINMFQVIQGRDISRCSLSAMMEQSVEVNRLSSLASFDSRVCKFALAVKGFLDVRFKN
jgi:hypothetical protein